MLVLRLRCCASRMTTKALPLVGFLMTSQWTYLHAGITWCFRVIAGWLMMKMMAKLNGNCTRDSKYIPVPVIAFFNICAVCTFEGEIHVRLLYSRRFSHYSAPIHWLVHGHMTSNTETVFHQVLWALNIAKTMTLNGKHLTHLFCYTTNHLITGPFGNSEFFSLESRGYPRHSSRETLRFSGNKFSVPLGTSHSPTLASSLNS